MALAISLVPSGCPDPDPEPITTDSESSGTTAAESADGTTTTGIDSTTGDTSTTTGDTTNTTTDDTTTGGEPPAAPVLALGFSPVKQFDFTWAAVDGADHYELLESATPGEPFVALARDITGESISITTALHLRHRASYVLRACNEAGCTDSAPVDVVGSLAEAVGYVKASNTGADDGLGRTVALSSDGSTLAVGAIFEDSGAVGIDGDEADDSTEDAGAVYVFVRDPSGAWSQQAYVKASNPGAGDWFGWSVGLSADGNTLAVGAYREDSNATGIGGNQASDAAAESGAAYVFVRDAGGAWSQQAYVKASNTGAGDAFGHRVSLSDDGDTLAVGAYQEGSSATGIAGDQANDAAPGSGAAYVLVRDAGGTWSQQAYVKASNTDADDWFGWTVALSGDGSTLAVGAQNEDSSATGIDGDQTDDSTEGAGAVYVFERDPMDQWSQQAYVKASNPGVGDGFGVSVALSEAASTLAVGAWHEASNATGIDGDQANDAAQDAGAVYVFERDPMDQWSQQAYVKASNTEAEDQLGWDVALSGDGSTLAVGATLEDGGTTGVGGDPAEGFANGSGAVYVLVRDASGQWSERAYVKASNTGFFDYFGWSVALSDTADTLAVGAFWEDSDATGIGGDQTNDLALDAGAVYLY